MVRHFKLREAEGALFKVEGLIAAGLRIKGRIEEVRAAIEALDEGEEIDDDFQLRLFGRLHEHHQLSADLFKILESLERLGVVVKNFDTGLVDFPCLFEGREIFLCWKLGEPRISYWHELEDGFAGRKEIVDMGFEVQEQ